MDTVKGGEWPVEQQRGWVPGGAKAIAIPLSHRIWTLVVIAFSLAVTMAWAGLLGYAAMWWVGLIN
jgi:hypothetical protein